MSDSTPFILTDDTKNDTTKMISVKLSVSVLPIYKNNFTEEIDGITGGYTKTPLKGGYIQIPYKCPGDIIDPPVKYADNATNIKNYITSNLYIFKKSHLISDITYDAELVVELTPITNTGDILYLCFLLKSYRDAKKPENNIDNIIKKSDNIVRKYKGDTCNIQPLIEKNQKKIVYKDGNNTVIIFPNTIGIKEYDFSKYNTVPNDLFKLTPSVPGDYNIIPPTATQEGFQEGVDTNGKTAVMTCTPINTNTKLENDNSIIQINTENVSSMTSYVLTAGILICLSTSIIGVFISPKVFGLLILNPNLSNNERMLYMIIFCVLLVILSIVLIVNGRKYNPKNQPLVGLMFILFLIFSACGFTLNENLSGKISAAASAFSLSAGIYDIISKYKKNSMYIIPGFCIYILVLCVIYLFGIKKKFAKTKNINKKDIDNVKKMVLGFGITYGFVVFVFLNSLNTEPE